jgi:beta-lactamase class A
VALSDELGAHEWDLRGDEPFAAGDTLSLFILLELLHQVDSGEVDLGDSVAVPASAARAYGDRGAMRGILASLDSVKSLSLRDVAILMMAEGDVVAMNLAIDKLGFEAVGSRAAKCGAMRTVICRRPGVAAPPENYTCAKDVAAVWKALTIGSTLSPDIREEAAKILRASRTRSRVVPGNLSSADIRISYDGDSPGRSAVVHASGVIHLPEGPLMFAILGENMQSIRDGEDVMSRVAQMVHDHYENESLRPPAKDRRAPLPQDTAIIASADMRPSEER